MNVRELRAQKADAKAQIDSILAGLTGETLEEKLAAMDENASADYDAATQLFDEASEQLASAEAELKARVDRAKAAAQATAAPTATRSATTSTPRSEADPKRGFATFGDFAREVVRAAGDGPSERLRAAAPSNYGNETTGADGGFAVPPEFRSEIMRRVYDNQASLFNLVSPINISSNSLTVPTGEATAWGTSGIQAYWTSEAGSITTSKPVLKQLSVKAEKLAALVPVTDELLEDSGALTTYINGRASDAITFKIDDAYLNGGGAGEPLGILSGAGLVSVAKETSQTDHTIVYENVLKMYARMPVNSRQRAVWIVHPDAEIQLQQMVLAGASSDVPVWLPAGGISGQPFATLFGRPVIPHQAAQEVGAVGDITFLDPTQYLGVVRGGMRNDVSIHLYFDYDITAFRFIMRVGGAPWWNATIADKNGSTTRSPYVALALRDS